MALIEWTSQYSVNIPTIDTQHRKIFAMINELHDAMKAGQGNAAAPVVLRKLIAYTLEHFAAEEEMLTNAGYPQLAEHKAGHRKLAAEAERMANEYETKGVRIGIALAEFLREWLQKHILQTDMQYSEHMQTAGVH